CSENRTGPAGSTEKSGIGSLSGPVHMRKSIGIRPVKNLSKSVKNLNQSNRTETVVYRHWRREVSSTKVSLQTMITCSAVVTLILIAMPNLVFLTATLPFVSNIQIPLFHPIAHPSPHGLWKMREEDDRANMT
ncbi:hypothetical protein PIB30_087481, partial [Stylosanthes scabra]|nr:hypothetical protein [Stylosanthes scabra]